MRSRPQSAVHAANDLTARWCASLGVNEFVVSGAGLWPLLALLASAADEPARSELLDALGRPANDVRREALELIDILGNGESTAAALGIWVRKDVPLHSDWTSELPSGVMGELLDQASLDRWVARHTRGLIDSFPIDINPDTYLTIASALVARTRWREPFTSWRLPQLTRVTRQLDVVAILDGAVTRVVVEGDSDLDVHLVMGHHHPASVLATGLRELSGDISVQIGSTLAVGSKAPGLTVRLVDVIEHGDLLDLSLPAFEIRAKHHLLAHSEVFGLRSITDPTRGHLPLLSPQPLYVSSGAQDILATFSAEGFEAAAATAIDVSAGCATPTSTQRVKVIEVNFDRPFGFIAVHRPSRLAVVTGWVVGPFRANR